MYFARCCMPVKTNSDCCCVDFSLCFCRDNVDDTDGVFLPDELTATIINASPTFNCPCWDGIVVPLIFEVGACFPDLFCWFACFDLPNCLVSQPQGAFIKLECTVENLCSDFLLTIGQQNDGGGEACIDLGTCLNISTIKPDVFPSGCKCDPLLLKFTDLDMVGTDCCDDQTDFLVRRIEVIITE